MNNSNIWENLILMGNCKPRPKRKQQMTYHTLTDQEIERIFKEDVLGWEWNHLGQAWLMNIDDEGHHYTFDEDFSPLTNLDHAILGVEKLIKEKRCSDAEVGINSGEAYAHLYDEEWMLLIEVINPSLNHAIAEACIRIKRPDLFTENK